VSRGQAQGSDHFLAAAAQIAGEICGGAVWYQDRCNWVGATREEGPGGQPVIAYSALGPDLYGGTSGVAAFLAHLHAVTGDPEVRRTSLGAIRQAIAASGRLGAAGGSGLYTGRLGVALAAAWVAEALQEGGLLERAARLLEGLEPFGEGEFDLLSGRAGAIVGLLALRRLLGQEELVGRAARLGEELLDSAERTEAGYSWASPSFPTSGNLTGFSHGAAGAAHALLELFATTGDPIWRRGAEEAFAYERSRFDPEAANWPDLRATPGRGEGDPQSFATFWCHGAPGIALSRLRAQQVLHDERFGAEAAIAIETTSAALAVSLPSRTGNFSLCHGHAGNAEVLLQADAILGPRHGSGRDLALQVAEAGIESYGDRDEPWPCGTYEGTTPNLFLGLAGIGLFYLRLHDPRIPSPLMIGGELFSSDPRDGGMHEETNGRT
jgi:lantibiotic biosynthesis protein